jgi:putative DNA primase/helicase
MPVISQGKDEEELEKRLSGELIEGALLVAIDNCTRPLSGAFLDKVLTEQALKVRLLGQTGNVLTPVNCLLLATGNNLAVAADLTRRAIICSMDAQCERPELRRFEIDIFKKVRAERGQVVAAVLTILRAWHVRKPQDVAVPYLGSFEEWAFRICGPLISWAVPIRVPRSRRRGKTIPTGRRLSR